MPTKALELKSECHHVCFGCATDPAVFVIVCLQFGNSFSIGRFTARVSMCLYIVYACVNIDDMRVFACIHMSRTCMCVCVCVCVCVFMFK